MGLVMSLVVRVSLLGSRERARESYRGQPVGNLAGDPREEGTASAHGKAGDEALVRGAGRYVSVSNLHKRFLQLRRRDKGMLLLCLGHRPNNIFAWSTALIA